MRATPVVIALVSLTICGSIAAGRDTTEAASESQRLKGKEIDSRLQMVRRDLNHYLARLRKDPSLVDKSDLMKKRFLYRLRSIQSDAGVREGVSQFRKEFRSIRQQITNLDRQISNVKARMCLKLNGNRRCEETQKRKKPMIQKKRMNVASGTISGTVTDEVTSQPLNFVTIEIYDSQGEYTSYAYSDSSGGYTSEPLSAGSYFVKTAYTSHYVDEVYDNINCESCDATTGAPVAVTDGSVIAGIDFALSHGGSISGIVTDATTSNPITNFSVYVYNAANFNFVGAADAQGGGTYVADGLENGTYVLVTSNYDDYIDEVYDNISCSAGCDIENGTPVSVTLGNTTSGIDFALQPGGHISGTITDADLFFALSDIEVQIYDSVGNFVAYGYSDASGSYTTIGPLDTGNYFAVTSNYSGYLNEAYDDIRCRGECDPVKATPIAVIVGQTTSGINFALKPAGKIGGRVLGADNSPIPDSYVDIYDSRGRYTTYAYPDSDGYYKAIGLLTGNYYAVTSNYAGYVDELYNNKPCPYYNCVPESGTPIAVKTGFDTGNIDFFLSYSGSIEGTVTDETSSIPIPDVFVDIFDSHGDAVAYAYTDSSGHYSALSQLTTGKYYARAASYDNYVTELYKNIVCFPECNPKSGTPISVIVENATTGIDFALSKGGVISGTITEVPSGNPIDDANVYIFDQTGSVVAYGFTFSPGTYRAFGGLPSGTYYAATGSYEYVDELYNNLPCAFGDCDPLTGTPIPVTVNSETSGINFDLQLGGTINGVVLDETTLQPIESEVRIFDSNGIVRTYGYTDSAGNYIAQGLPTGNYFAATYAYYGDGYVDELYDNIQCPQSECDVLIGTPIAVTAAFKASNVDFYLSTILLYDDFEDSLISSVWNYSGGIWAENAGSLSGTDSKKARVLASPIFGGCRLCSIETTIRTTGGGGSYVSLIGWYANKQTYIELVMDEQNDAWIFRQHRTRSIVKRVKANQTVDPNTNYKVNISWDGYDFHVLVDDNEILTITSETVFGTVGFQIKGTGASFDYVLVK